MLAQFITVKLESIHMSSNSIMYKLWYIYVTADTQGNELTTTTCKNMDKFHTHNIGQKWAERKVDSSFEVLTG